MHKITGGCHCGNITLDVTLPQMPETYNPRACDCDFCRKHGAAYLSDPAGKLAIGVRESESLGYYRQGSEVADCLFCRNCGVLIGVSYRDDGRCFATVNVSALDGTVRFGERKSVSPKLLSAQEKVERWKSLWFADVSIRLDT